MKHNLIKHSKTKKFKLYYAYTIKYNFQDNVSVSTYWLSVLRYAYYKAVEGDDEEMRGPPQLPIGRIFPLFRVLGKII